MSLDVDALYALLPQIYRIRDAERDEPLRQLLTILADQAAILEDNLAQLHDDQFVETCAPWVLPYIGDLLGITGLPRSVSPRFSPRAEVANTLGYRRRKGTAAMLEQLARDTTGWTARAVECFELLATTQYLNHIRPGNQSFVAVRDAERLEWLGTAFERYAPHKPALGYGGKRPADLVHTADVRHMAARDGVPRPVGPGRPPPRIVGARGRYNIPHVAVFLFRLQAQPLTGSPAVRLDAHRFVVHPLGIDAPLFNHPRPEDAPTDLTEPVHVAAPIGRRALKRDLEAKSDDEIRHYDGSITISTVDDQFLLLPTPIPRGDVEVCDLTGWVRKPSKRVGIDPVLGRIVFQDPQPAARVVLVDVHHGFSADMGGGEYDRGTIPAATNALLVPVRRDGKDGAERSIKAALATIAASQAEDAIIEIRDSSRYEGNWSIPPLRRLEIRAADKRRPIVVFTDDLDLDSRHGGTVVLDGLLISGGAVVVGAAVPLRRLRIRHCTLVPGLARTPDGEPVHANRSSVRVHASACDVEIEHSIVGALRIHTDARAVVRDSVVDACGETHVAYTAPRDDDDGGSLHVENSTVIGKVRAVAVELASNTLFLARLKAGDTWAAPIAVRRRQEGCVRFSYVPPGSLVPRRHRCQPDHHAGAADVRPEFDSLRYGDPAYCRLGLKCPPEIRLGADDESEMGAFHSLFQPQREAHLRARLEEYLRFGLEVGLVYAT